MTAKMELLVDEDGSGIGPPAMPVVAREVESLEDLAADEHEHLSLRGLVLVRLAVDQVPERTAVRATVLGRLVRALWGGVSPVEALSIVGPAAVGPVAGTGPAAARSPRRSDRRRRRSDHLPRSALCGGGDHRR
jgi:hypothetical protein